MFSLPGQDNRPNLQDDAYKLCCEFRHNMIFVIPFSDGAHCPETVTVVMIFTKICAYVHIALKGYRHEQDS